MAAGTDDLLDLRGIGQRMSTFRFDVLDQTLARIGTIAPSRGDGLSIENNSNRRIKRSLTGFRIWPGAADAFNLLQVRIRPVMVLENGSEHPTGVFLFLDASGAVYSYGSVLGTSLGDQLVILDTPTTGVFGLSVGVLVSDALSLLFEEAGILTGNYEIDPIATTIGTPIAWPPGTSILAIMNQLAAMAGCYSVYFNNAGIGRVQVRQDLETTVPAVRYRAANLDGNIVRGSIIETDQTYIAPNRYLVIDNSANTEPITATFDIPDEAPNSFANINRYITRTLNEQGLQDSQAALERARAAYQQDARDYKWTSFSGPQDPRHDTFDIIDYLGERWREQKWTMSLATGGRMAHDLRKIVETGEGL